MNHSRSLTWENTILNSYEVILICCLRRDKTQDRIQVKITSQLQQHISYNAYSFTYQKYSIWSMTSLCQSQASSHDLIHFTALKTNSRQGQFLTGPRVNWLILMSKLFVLILKSSLETIDQFQSKFNFQSNKSTVQIPHMLKLLKFSTL